MPEHFSCAIGAAWIEAGSFVLWRLLHFAEHLRTRSLQEPCFRLMLANGFQDANNSQPGYVCRQHRLAPGRRHETLRGEVVNLVGLDCLYDVIKGRLIREIPFDQSDLVD